MIWLKWDAEAPWLRRCPNYLLMQVFYYPTNYTAKRILFITLHHHIQEFAKGGASLNQKPTLFYAEVYGVYPASDVLNKLLRVENASWKTSEGKNL